MLFLRYWDCLAQKLQMKNNSQNTRTAPGDEKRYFFALSLFYYCLQIKQQLLRKVYSQSGRSKSYFIQPTPTCTAHTITTNVWALLKENYFSLIFLLKMLTPLQWIKLNQKKEISSVSVSQPYNSIISPTLFCTFLLDPNRTLNFR